MTRPQLTRIRHAAIGAAAALACGGATRALAQTAPSAEAADADVLTRDAALRGARTLAWAGRLADACGRYDAWLRAHPGDVEAQLGRARTLAWAHRYPEAAAAYAAVRRQGGGIAAREAAKGEAQLAAWRGDLAGAAAAWRALAASTPEDAEVWVGLGQTLRWAGDVGGAEQALRRAEAIAPGQPDAAEQRRWLRPELGGTAGPTVDYLSDTDGDRNVRTRLGVDLPRVGPVAASVQASRLDAALGAWRGTSTRVGAAARLPLGGRAALAAELGGAALSGRTPDRRASGAALLGVAAVRGTLRAADGSTFTLGVARAPFDETAPLVAAHVWTAGVAAGGDVRLGQAVELTLAGERAGVHGASGVNARTAGSAELRWQVPLAAAPDAAGNSVRRVELFGGARAYGYARAAADGYFAPRAMTLAEGGARLRAGRALGWQLDVEAGAGRQQVRPWDAAADARLAMRGAARVAYRFVPGTELSLQGTHTTAASPGLAAGGPAYHATGVTVDARVLLPRRSASLAR